MQVCLYGASSNVLAQSYLDAAYDGGRVIGVAPSFFNVDGILYDQCDEFIYTETMRERKGIMDEKAEGFLLAPGGIGSFEEFFEILTLKQLGKHNRPIAVLNTNGYYVPLHAMLEHAVKERFATAPCLQLYRLCPTPADAVDYLEHYNAAALDVKHLKNI